MKYNNINRGKNIRIRLFWDRLSPRRIQDFTFRFHILHLPLFVFKLALYFSLPHQYFSFRQVFCFHLCLIFFGGRGVCFLVCAVWFAFPLTNIQLSYFMWFSAASLYTLRSHLACTSAIKFWSHLYIKDTKTLQEALDFHLMKLAYNPFKTVNPRLSFNHPPSACITLPWQFGKHSMFLVYQPQSAKHTAVTFTFLARG